MDHKKGMKTKEYNPMLDIFGLFCSTLVVIEHLKPFGIERYPFFFSFLETALFFFMVKSGYFFMYRLSIGTLNLEAFTKRLLIPALFWSTIYNLYRLINVFLYHTETVSEYLTVLLKSLLINGSGVHLWYLPAVVLFSLFVKLLYKNNKISIVYISAVILFMMGLLSSTYTSFDMLRLFDSFKNNEYLRTVVRVFFMGYPMFVLGVFIEDKKELVSTIPDIILPILCAGSLILSYFEIKAMRSSFNMCSIFLTLYVFFIFIVLIKTKNKKYAALARIGKSISSFTYYSHPMFRIFFLTLIETMLKEQSNPSMIFILTLVSCFLIGIIINLVNNKHLNLICS